MKNRWKMVCLGLLLAFCCALPAQAATYGLSDLDMMIEIPDQYEVITRDNLKTGSSYDEETAEQYLGMLIELDIYLNAVNFDTWEELTLLVYPTEAEDFRGLDDNMLMEYASYEADSMPERGYTCTNYDVYRHGQVNFLVFDFWMESDGVRYYFKEYETAYEGQWLNLSFYAGISPVSRQQAESLKNIVDSMDFDMVTWQNGFRYHELDMSFTLPDGWTEEAPFTTVPRTVYFVNETTGDRMQYYWVDAWGSQEGEGEWWYIDADLTRKNLEQDDIWAFSVDYAGVFADGSTVSSDQQGPETYGGAEYLSFLHEINTPAGTRWIKQNFVAHNGYLHLFQYISEKETPDFSEFYWTLDSVGFEEIDATADVEDDGVKSELAVALTVITPFLFSLLLYTVPALCCRPLAEKGKLSLQNTLLLALICTVFSYLVIRLSGYGVDRVSIAVLFLVINTYSLVQAGKGQFKRIGTDWKNITLSGVPDQPKTGRKTREGHWELEQRADDFDPLAFERKICPKCKGEVSARSRFCSHCDAKLE